MVSVAIRFNMCPCLSVSFGWALGSGSSLSSLRNKCYVAKFLCATFVTYDGCDSGGNNFPKRAVSHSKRPKITPRLVMPHNMRLSLSGRAGWHFAPFLASSL